MRRRRRFHREQGDVELNMASMLDMAFQLLTFFILTFKPAPIEGQILLRLPPPQPVTKGTQQVGSDFNSKDLAKGVETLTISVFADQSGDIGTLGVGEASVPNLPALEERLRQIFADRDGSFDQVLIQAGSDLRYEALMKVVDVCTRIKLPDGKPLSKLSFIDAGG
jgi:biopolymer transport protein ExbD